MFEVQNIVMRDVTCPNYTNDKRHVLNAMKWWFERSQKHTHSHKHIGNSPELLFSSNIVLAFDKLLVTCTWQVTCHLHLVTCFPVLKNACEILAVFFRFLWSPFLVISMKNHWNYLRMNLDQRTRSVRPKACWLWICSFTGLSWYRLLYPTENNSFLSFESISRK